MTTGGLRAHRRQPVVVDADPGETEFGVLGDAQHRGLERDGLVVLTAVEDDFGGHTFEVEISPSGNGIVMTGNGVVAER